MTADSGASGHAPSRGARGGGKAPAVRRNAGPRSRPMDSEARWEEIIAASATIFMENGYEATSLQDIASAVGILKGSIYYYIKTKEDLLYELVDRALSLYAATVDEDPSLAAAPAPVRLRTFLVQWMTISAQEREWCIVAERSFNRLSPERLASVIERRDRYSAFVKDIIQQGVDEGTFDPEVDVSLATITVFELIKGSNEWHHPGGRLSMEAISEWTADFVIRGLGGTIARPAG